MPGAFHLSNALSKQPESDRCKFLILCQPRTGSSLLNASLRKHPELVMHREILNHQQPHKLPQDGKERIRAVFANQSAPAIGFNVHAFQPDRRWSGWKDWEPAWDAIAEDRGIKIIHLERLDTLAQFVSWKIAQMTGLWGEQKALTTRPTVFVERGELRWFREWNRAVFAWRLSHLQHHHILQITYESLYEGWEDSLLRIQSFLGVRQQSLPQAVQKNETRPLSEVITNWSDFVHEYAKD